MSVLGLLPPNAEVSGSIELGGTELIGLPGPELRRIRGGRVAMIFQEPMTSLNPVVPIGTQVTEVLRRHTDLDREQSRVEAEDLLRRGLAYKENKGGQGECVIFRMPKEGVIEYDDLVKGHMKKQAKDTIREVAEETGVQGSVLASLGSIDYWFVTDGRRVHKTVHHYLMRFLGGELSDEDVEVSEVAWVPLKELASRLAYADERALVERAPGLLADSA